MRWGIRHAWALGALASLGCPNLGAYFCAENTDCDRGGADGICLPDRACAYPDSTGTCDSGLVRSPNADRLPGECVDPTDTEATGSGGVADDSSTGDADGGTDVDPTGGVGTGSEDGIAMCGERLPVQIDTAALSPDEALTGYPLYLRVTDAPTVATLQAATDLVVADAQGVALAAEVEVGGSADIFAVWVTMPAHAAGERVALNLQWDAGLTAPSTSVWGDYVGVWHFDDVPTGVEGESILNSADAEVPGAAEGAMAAEQSIEGPMGRALRFDGADDSVNVAAPFVGSLDAFTISMWARYEGDSTQQDSYFNRLNGDSLYPRCWRQPESGDGSVFCQYRFDDGIVGMYTGIEHPIDAWLHIAMVRDPEANQTRVFVDGALAATADEIEDVLPPGDAPSFQLGDGEWGTFPGVLDETRVATKALPASWIAADSAHQRDPEAAVSIGSIEAVSCP